MKDGICVDRDSGSNWKHRKEYGADHQSFLLCASYKYLATKCAHSARSVMLRLPPPFEVSAPTGMYRVVLYIHLAALLH